MVVSNYRSARNNRPRQKGIEHRILSAKRKWHEKRKRKTKNRVTSHCRRKIPIGQTYARARWIFADIIFTTDKCAHIKSKQVERSQGRTITTGLYATPNYWNNCHVRDSWTTVIAPCLHFTWSRVYCTLLNQTVRCILLTMIAKHSP